MRKKRLLQLWHNPALKVPDSSESCASHRGRKDDSVRRSLATVCKAHQKALVTVATLEEEIDRLSHTQAHSSQGPDPRAQATDNRVEKGRRCIDRFGLKTHQPPAAPLTLKQSLVSRGLMARLSDLEESLELQPMVASFLRGSPKASKDETEEAPPEPLVLEFHLWVPWQAKKCGTPEWWPELSMVPGRDDARELAREVWVTFGLPWWMQELGEREATLQDPPAPPCLHRQ